MAFGMIKGSQYGERQKELVDLVTVVEAEDLKLYHIVDSAKEAFKIIKKSKPRKEF